MSWLCATTCWCMNSYDRPILHSDLKAFLTYDPSITQLISNGMLMTQRLRSTCWNAGHRVTVSLQNPHESDTHHFERTSLLQISHERARRTSFPFHSVHSICIWGGEKQLAALAALKPLNKLRLVGNKLHELLIGVAELLVGSDQRVV